MSYFDDASLVMIPSGYKDQKVYSVKPIDGSGDLTFTRSNDTATRVASNGLIERVRTNLALRSQSFATSAVWSTVNGTITDNAGTAPDGTNTASKIVATDADPFVYQTLTLSGQVAVSCYVKGIGSSIGKSGSIRAASSITNFSITGDWQRVVVVHNAGGAQTYGVETPEAAAVSDEVLLWGFQVETGDIATDYIATTTAAVSVGPVANLPRLDYSGGATCPKLLLEAQRTNAAQYSEQFDNAAWTKGNATISANTSATLDPSGYNGADKLQEDSSTDSHFFGSDTASASSAEVVTYSIFLKAAERSFAALRLYTGSGSIFGYYNLANGTLGTIGAGGTGTIVSYGNGWYRCSLTITMASSSVTLPYVFTSTGDGVNSYTGTTGSGIYCFGAQQEIGAYATSYIPTLGAAVTRGADSAYKTGISSLFGTNQGTFLMDFVYSDKSIAYGQFLFDVTDSTNYYRLLMYSEGGGTTYDEYSIYDSDSGVVATYNLYQNTRYKIGVKYNSTAIYWYINGSLVATGGAFGYQMEQIYLAQRYSLAENVAINLNQTLVFPTALTNAQLAELTTI